ncbi:hypothetical protein Hanom_Chr03g00183181 [Helianthus anomalus]
MTSTLVSCFLRFEVSFLADASSSSSFCNHHKKTVISYTQNKFVQLLHCVYIEFVLL